MQTKLVETIIGAVVLIVAGGFLWKAYEGSQMQVREGYILKARFDNIGGITTGSDVRIGGIKVGTVLDLTLDNETYEAVSTFQVANNTKIPTDSSAAIHSSSLLGDKFIAIVPGADDVSLKEGGEITYTQSSVSLEEMIGRFVFSGGGVEE